MLYQHTSNKMNTLFLIILIFILSNFATKMWIHLFLYKHDLSCSVMECKKISKILFYSILRNGNETSLKFSQQDWLRENCAKRTSFSITEVVQVSKNNNTLWLGNWSKFVWTDTDTKYVSKRINLKQLTWQKAGLKLNSEKYL